MSNYDGKHPLVLSRQLKVQKMCIPLFITSNATPASKTQANDEPAVLFLKTEGVNSATVAAGAFDTSAEAAAVTFASSTDTTGVFSVLLRASEQLAKVCYIMLVNRASNEMVSGTPPTGASAFITSLGDKIVANFDTATNFATTNGDYALEVAYVVQE